MSENWRYERALGRIDDFRRELGRTLSENVDLVEQERAVQKLVQDIGLELMREVFQQADTQSPEVTINGKKWGNRRSSDGTYTTTFGELKLPRSTYSPSGGGKIAVAIDYRLGIVEGRYTPLVAKIVCRSLASMPAEEAAALLKEAGIAAVSSSTLHRLPALLSARYEKNREAFDNAVMEHETVPEAAATVQVGLDGVMIPQDGEDTNPPGRKRGERPSAPKHKGMRRGMVL